MSVLHMALLFPPFLREVCVCVWIKFPLALLHWEKRAFIFSHPHKLYKKMFLNFLIWNDFRSKIYYKGKISSLETEQDYFFLKSSVSIKNNSDYFLSWLKSRLVFIQIPKKGNTKECSNYPTIALISHTSKVMLKILQARLQQYMNREPPDVQAGFRKGRGTWDQIANIPWIIKKPREFQKNTYSAHTLPENCRGR